jgi:hypothetical protein
MKMLNGKYLKKKIDDDAPPGAKAERMVKHIKKGYAKDGKLTDQERSIAYATAWKHHNRKTEDAEPTLATNKRTERILNLLRAKSPTAKNDLEALILSFDKGQMQDRMDISRLYKDDESIEQAVARLEQEIARLKQERTNESLTEAQFDEAAGEKDACYHKVKSRYKVWPSAYASGALVQCRKKGAANWGNSKKK